MDLAREELAAKLWDRVWKPNLDDCWLWEGATNPSGYGKMRVGGSHVDVHRVVVALVVGRPLQDSEVVDHLCRIKQCCNPLHLDLTDQSTNTRRGYAANPGITW